MKRFITNFRFGEFSKPVRLGMLAGASVLLILFGAIMGVALGRCINEPSLDTGKIGELCVLPDTLVRVVKNYNCGHSEVYETKEYTGYTESMLNSIDGCRVETMTREYVSLIIDSSECCGSHYLLMLVDEDVLCVFSTDEEKYGKEQLMEIQMDVSKIAETEYVSLKKGIVFDSLEQINAYIEGMET